MKAKEVLQILGITRMTLTSYVKKGFIKVTVLPSGRYVYDSESVYKLIKKGKDGRQNVIYSRVSTYKQKKDLNNQKNKLIKYCQDNDIKVNTIYSEIASGLDLERKQFSKLLNDVINYKIAKIYITYNDRLTRLSFKTIRDIFAKFGTEIISIEGKKKNNNSEIMEELISLMHIFSTKMYSKRKKKNINDLTNEENNLKK